MIKLERDYFVKDGTVEQVVLKQIKIKIYAGDSEKACQCKFVIVPHLFPPAIEEVKKRLPLPVKYEIEPLPHKIKLQFPDSRHVAQALVGDPVKIAIGISQEPDILLKSIKV